jgi:hypothetical protein
MIGIRRNLSGSILFHSIAILGNIILLCSQARGLLQTLIDLQCERKFEYNILVSNKRARTSISNDKIRSFELSR